MLTLVLPTYNEAANLPAIIGGIVQALEDIPHEIIVVDDNSPDGTWRVAEELRVQYPQLRVVRRMDKRGLSSAVVDGFLAGRGTVLAAMDADGQHDSGLLRKLYEHVRGFGGIALGSRYVQGGDIGEWDGGRHRMSKFATKLAMWVLRRPDAAAVQDPMSGFFAIDRATFLDAHPRLKPKGFKILLDLLVHAKPGTPAHELPMRFGKRIAGESKLDWKVQWEYLSYLYDITLGRWISLWALVFGVVLAAACAVLALRAIPLLPLYADAGFRSDAAVQLRSLAGARGWLLSDMRIASVTPSTMFVIHESHPQREPVQGCFVSRSGSPPPACGNL